MLLLQHINRFLQRVHIQPERPQYILSPEDIKKFVQLIQSSQKAQKQPLYSDEGHHGQKISSKTGQGMDYTESRKYSPDDDVRSINWMQSARSRDLIVNVYLQENEVTDYVLLDTRQAMYFGTLKQPKISVALKTLMKTVLDSLARKHEIKIIQLNNSHINVHEVSDLNSALRIINQLSLYSEEIQEYNVSLQSLSSAARFIKTATPSYSIISVISDFFDIDDLSKSIFNSLSARNNLQFFRITDQLENNIPNFYPIEYQSLQSDESITLNNAKDVVNIRQQLHQSNIHITELLTNIQATVTNYSTLINDVDIVN